MKKRFILIMTAFTAISSLCLAATIHVPGDYPKIQAGIDAAQNGDKILVAGGTYYENINFSGKAIKVTSEKGWDVTVIDGNQSGSVIRFEKGEGLNSVIEGFTITNGSGTWVGGIFPGYFGGGIFCNGSSPTMSLALYA